MDTTYYSHQHHGKRIISAVIEKSLRFLENSEMIVENGDQISATEFGTLVSQLYIDPKSADIIVEHLRRVTEYSDMGLLQLICSTPDMYTLYVANRDLHYLERFICEHDRELWLNIPLDNEEAYFRGLKTSMLLFDWAQEIPEPMICERYSVGPGIYTPCSKA